MRSEFSSPACCIWAVAAAAGGAITAMGSEGANEHRLLFWLFKFAAAVVWDFGGGLRALELAAGEAVCERAVSGAFAQLMFKYS